jgi:hypothetical protein
MISGSYERWTRGGTRGDERWKEHGQVLVPSSISIGIVNPVVARSTAFATRQDGRKPSRFADHGRGCWYRRRCSDGDVTHQRMRAFGAPD